MASIGWSRGPAARAGDPAGHRPPRFRARHSVGPDRTNFADRVDFVIDNYQANAYPRAMVVPAAQGAAAAEEFFHTRARPAAVEWLEA